MATIVRDFPVDAPVETVWRDIADVGGVNRLIDALGDVTVEGDRRTCQLGDAGLLDELIVAVDEDHRRVAYSIRQSPFGLEHHHASMQAVGDGDRARFVWVTDLTPDSAAPGVEQAIDGAVESITRHFAGQQ